MLTLICLGGLLIDKQELVSTGTLIEGPRLAMKHSGHATIPPGFSTLDLL